jgi:hypothetical protein
MANPEVHKARDAARRFGSSLRGLVRRVADDPLRQAGTAAVTSRVRELLHLGNPERPPQPATPSQPTIPLINLRKSLGRAAVACENHDECGGTIELALYEHSANNSEVGEVAVIDATMISQTCQCDLSEDERDRVIDRVQEAIRARA